MAEQESMFDRDPSDVGRTAAPDEPEPTTAPVVEIWNHHVHGIWKRFYFGDEGITLDSAAVNRARAEHGFVGTCRQCGGNIAVVRGRNHNGAEVDWMDFACVSCGHEVAAPNGKRLARDSRHNHMPQGWWARRMAALKSAKAF